MLKKKDQELIKCLRHNSRSQLKEMSKKTKIPITTIFERMKKIDNIIIKNTTLFDYSKMAYPIMIMYAFKIEEKYKKNINHFLNNNKNVNNVFRLNGGYNYLVEALFKDMKEANQFVEIIKESNPRRLIEHQIIEEIQKEEFYIK